MLTVKLILIVLAFLALVAGKVQARKGNDICIPLFLTAAILGITAFYIR